jgi:limonene-1,2-epoxide hydrolase
MSQLHDIAAHAAHVLKERQDANIASIITTSISKEVEWR